MKLDLDGLSIHDAESGDTRAFWLGKGNNHMGSFGVVCSLNIHLGRL